MQDAVPLPIPPASFTKVGNGTVIFATANTYSGNTSVNAGVLTIQDPRGLGFNTSEQQKVTVTGFMLPVKMHEGLVTEFLLVKDPMMCCYGVMPKVNEWVVVKMNGKGVAPLMDVPITFEGTLKVGQIYEGGYLTGLYLLQGDRRVESKG